MLLIRNAAVWPMKDGTRFDHGYVLCDGGRIRETGLGDGLTGSAASGVHRILDAQGGVVMPGLIDAHCHLGVFADGGGVEGDDGNEETDPITPHLRSVDAIHHEDRCFREAAAAGVTSVMTGPGSANVLGGQFTFLKTVGRDVDAMALKAPAAMKAAFGENPKKNYGPRHAAPATRMATAALLRETLFKAERYAKEIAASEAGGASGGKRPDFDMKLEALLPVMAREIPLKIHAHRADDLLTAMRICEEFGLRYTLEHATEGYRIVDAILAAMEGKGRRSTLEGVVVGPLLLDRSKPELRNSDLRNPGLLAAAGIPVALMTDHPCVPIQHLLVGAAVSVREGMDEEAALRAVTIHAARVCGVADRVGSIEPGKDADLVVFTGHPLDYRTKVRFTVVDGVVVHGA